MGAAGGGFPFLAEGKPLPKNPSRVVDPSNGLVPYRPEAKARRDVLEARAEDSGAPHYIDTPGHVLVLYNQYQYYWVDRDTIQYSATFEEPSIYTQPWTMFVPMKRDAEMDREQFWEYGCHEGEETSTHLDDRIKESAAHYGEVAWARAHAGPASSIPVRRRYTCFSSGVAL